MLCNVYSTEMDTSKGKVLIVDDEPDIREGFRHILDWDSLGLSIIGMASSGEEALSIIKEVVPDIVISDIVMKGLSGLDVIRMAREAGIASTQFILISGYNEFRYAQTAISLGVSDYILKPISKDELEAAVLKIRRKAGLSANTASVDVEILRKNAKHLFIQHMINGEIRSKQELDEGISNFGVGIRDMESSVITFANRDGHSIGQSAAASEYIRENHAEAIEDRNRTIVIINGSEKVALHFTRQMLEMLSKGGFPSFVAGIGPTMPSLIGIDRSYALSIAALSYQAYGGNKKIFTALDISKARPALSTSNLDIDKLRNLIGKEDEKGIADYMDDIFNALFFAETPPPSYIKGMLLFLINGIERNLVEEEDIDPKALEEIRPDIADPMLMMKDIRRDVADYFITISRSVIPEVRIQSDRIIRESRRYVQEHLYSRISEDELASSLGVSQPYLSVYFSRTTGETFRSYVNRTRNDEAKKLLESGMSIDEVSETLGYSDYRSFHRIFKRMNGESPSQWKKHTAR